MSQPPPAAESAGPPPCSGSHTYGGTGSGTSDDTASNDIFLLIKETFQGMTHTPVPLCFVKSIT